MIQVAIDYIQRLRQGTISGWNWFWFTGVDPATLGLIRILCGWMLVYTHLVWTKGLDRFLSSEAMLAPGFVREFHGSTWAWSHLYWIESPTVLWIAHLAAIAVFLAFMVGFQTRWTGVLSFLFAVAYANRTVHAFVWTGSDQLFPGALSSGGAQRSRLLGRSLVSQSPLENTSSDHGEHRCQCFDSVDSATHVRCLFVRRVRKIAG